MCVRNGCQCTSWFCCYVILILHQQRVKHTSARPPLLVAAGTSRAKLREMYNELGDMGDVAQACRHTQVSVQHVHHLLQEMNTSIAFCLLSKVAFTLR